MEGRIGHILKWQIHPLNPRRTMGNFTNFQLKIETQLQSLNELNF